MRTRDEPIGSHTLSSASSQTQVPDDGHTYNVASGVRVDPERGKDVHVVDWYGPDDPDNPRNWSNNMKSFVTFEICLFSIYIGSAILA